MEMEKVNTAYLSFNSKLDWNYHREHWIIHNGLYYLAEFDKKEQLDFFAETLGFTYEMKDGETTRTRDGEESTYIEYTLSHSFEEEPSFWKREDVPALARPVKLLSNGRIVTGYVWNDGKTIHIYRPNPNAKEVYKPMSLEDHIAYKKVMGVF